MKPKTVTVYLSYCKKHGHAAGMNKRGMKNISDPCCHIIPYKLRVPKTLTRQSEKENKCI